MKWLSNWVYYKLCYEINHSVPLKGISPIINGFPMNTPVWLFVSLNNIKVQLEKNMAQSDEVWFQNHIRNKKLNSHFPTTKEQHQALQQSYMEILSIFVKNGFKFYAPDSKFMWGVRLKMKTQSGTTKDPVLNPQLAADCKYTANKKHQIKMTPTVDNIV